MNNTNTNTNTNHEDRLTTTATATTNGGDGILTTDDITTRSCPRADYDFANLSWSKIPTPLISVAAANAAYHLTTSQDVNRISPVAPNGPASAI